MRKRILLPLLVCAALLLCLSGCELFHTHEYIQTVTPPSCTEGGYSTFTCRCEDSYVDHYTQALGHNYAVQVLSPTCTEGGYSTYTCTVCNDSYRSDITQPAGHSYTEEVVSPTCTEGGYSTFTCHCGDTYVGAETQPVAHGYDVQVIPATCREGGYSIFTCRWCGDSYNGDETKAVGHSYVASVVAPTDTQMGYTKHTCSGCGRSYKDNYIFPEGGVPASFFDDAAFVGDSITMALRNYADRTGALGTAIFLCRGSYSANHAVKNTMYMQYQGKEMTLQKAVATCGAKKIFILLGMNDIALVSDGVNLALKNWATMVANIRAESPDVEIYIQSGTPIYTGGEKGGLNNTRMDKYNERLKAFAAENGCYYIDIATPMKDSTNGLAKKYCSDEYVHLTSAGCELWVSILKDYFGE